ncbi:unnamed protein product [Adineta steineri]|uniref:Peptidase C1A papain C-terminal domain-containing protein n=1 Tax=Adineta steineri TaxID=433720 RepID=A0A814YC35_9BILA|nr:unnamed protein product [Adineta steineri]CAF4012241.1 unnamed protein product [Adineta steineri]
MPLKTYIVNKTTGEKYRLNGVLPSASLPAGSAAGVAKAFAPLIRYPVEELPPKVDLRNDMTEIENQDPLAQQIGSCTANSLAGAYEYLNKKAHGTSIRVSRFFIYYNSRAKEFNTSQVYDTGCYLVDAIEALDEFGTCLESFWPYDTSRVNIKPTDEAYQQASGHKINDALKVNIDLNEMKLCLAHGFPFAFAIKLFNSFLSVNETGAVPIPNQDDIAKQLIGMHALLAVGYSEESQAFLVRNSWGQNWGEKGYCYIPYAYLANPDYTDEAFAIRKVANDDFGQDNWYFNDDTNFLANMPMGSSNNHTIEQYDEDDEDASCNPPKYDASGDKVNDQDASCNTLKDDSSGDKGNDEEPSCNTSEDDASGDKGNSEEPSCNISKDGASSDKVNNEDDSCNTPKDDVSGDKVNDEDASCNAPKDDATDDKVNSEDASCNTSKDDASGDKVDDKETKEGLHLFSSHLIFK